MDTAAIIAALEAERDRLNRAIAALQVSGRGKSTMIVKPAKGRRRHMNAAARKRISDAMKKRWAARKKST